MLSATYALEPSLGLTSRWVFLFFQHILQENIQLLVVFCKMFISITVPFNFSSTFNFTLKLEDTLWAGLTDLHIKLPMGITAENLAEKYQLTREECDLFAYQSQQKWKAGAKETLTLS